MNFCQTPSSRLQGEYSTTLQVLPNLEIKRSMKTLNNIDMMATMLTALKSRHSYYNVQALILRNHDRLIVGGQGISFAEWKIANYVHECLWPLLLLHSVHYELALHPSVTHAFTIELAVQTKSGKRKLSAIYHCCRMDQMPATPNTFLPIIALCHLYHFYDQPRHHLTVFSRHFSISHGH